MRIMGLHGKNFIGAHLSGLGKSTFYGFNPRTSRQLDMPFHQATEEEIGRALELAAQAFPVLREVAPQAIAGLLETIAAGIEELGDQLIEQAAAETGLGRDRLTSERGRTVNQLRL